MSRSPIAARLLVPALVALTLAGCAVRRPPSPESTRQLRVAAVRRVVDQPALSPAAWSPDGRRFAYATAGGVYVGAPEQPPQRIAPARVPTELVWSARLDLLAVVDGGVVWVMRPDGTGRHRLDLPGFVTAAAWSPGGDRLAVVLRRGAPGAPSFELWLASPGGQFRRVVTRAPAGRAMRALQWFPNSLYLFYGLSGLEDDVITEAWRVRVAYPDHRRLPLPDAVLHPRLAPGGEAVACLVGDAVRDGRGRIVVVPLDGRGRVTVTPDEGRYTAVAWSPQGDKLAYALVTDEANAEVWIADADASGRLAAHAYALEYTDPSIELRAAWSPDGHRLLFGTNTGAFRGPIWLAVLERR